ncbi:hypothetical protein [Mesorhizobium carmichaelinearum]|uniref:hypothetical protein n=1 Tax=Mesorhizobium carmichaelinearum TaxID=1208188 RepID=UPI000BA2C929|nr:hypothetical protein [Mesorhizobium carmichaelinearum]
MLTRHVALVSDESSIQNSELVAVAGALQKQVTRDFGPIWGIQADVSAFEKLEDMPLDYWPIIIKDDIGNPNAAGYHEDQHGQPFSLVQFSAGWHLTASHELLEMLGDPFGRRMVAGQSPVATQGRVKFLVEVCDPCEAEQFAYTVNGITVSDFYTPHYLDPVASAGVRYSYTGAIKEPRQVLKGGYLSWYDPSSRQWWQRTWFGGTKAADGALQNLKVGNGNLRQAIDRLTQTKQAEAQRRGAKPPGKAAMAARKPDMAFANHAADLRATIAVVTKKATAAAVTKRPK